METANFLANLWGVYLVIVPLSLLMNPKMLRDIFTAVEKETTTYFCGIIALVIGTITLLLNNVWAGDWRTIVTLLGWASFAKGIVLLFWTKKAMEKRSKLKNADWHPYALLATIFLGLVLLYFGVVGK